MNDLVETLVVDGLGNLYAGGWFTTAGGISANYITKWDGSGWSALGSGMDGGVSSLVIDGAGNLYAGGYFTNAGGRVLTTSPGGTGSAGRPLAAGQTTLSLLYRSTALVISMPAVNSTPPEG